MANPRFHVVALLALVVASTQVEAQAPKGSGSGEPWFVSKGDWTAKLSAPKYEIKFEWDRKIKMRDGVELSANVWRPKAEGKFPVVFMFMPYDNTAKTSSAVSDVLGHAKFLAPRGYAFVAVNVRGRYDSDGESYLYWSPEWRKGKHDGLDVDDCLTWLGTQPWSSGKIGMTGGSYLGFTQWLGAQLGNRYLTTIVPYVSPDDHHDNAMPNGALRLSVDMKIITTVSGRTNKSALDESIEWKKLYWHLPLRDMDELMLGKKLQNWQDYIDHPDNDVYWRPSVGERRKAGDLNPGKYSQVRVPSLNITGWYDTTTQFGLNNFMAMKRYGPEALRGKHHLIVGPWVHAVGPRKVGDIDFGPDAEVDFYTVELRWFDYWLKGIENGMMSEPPVNLFAMATNKWKTSARWPLAEAKETKYYFHSAGRANSRSGDGVLSTAAPADEPPDQYTYDPRDPVPSYGGNVVMVPRAENEGPRDQAAIETRKDVLVYSTEPLANDVEITGRIMVTLHAASSAPDTDFMAKLVDVHPNGYVQILTEGNIRARYRTSFMEQRLITPGQVYEYTLDLWSTSQVFKRGHRIRLEVTSSNFPKYDRNPNTGRKFGEDTELAVARQTIHHSKAYPSHVVLPIVEPAPQGTASRR